MKISTTAIVSFVLALPAALATPVPTGTPAVPCGSELPYSGDPFTASNGTVAGLALSSYNGLASLGAAFGQHWSYGDDAPISVYPTGACSPVYLDLVETRKSYKHLVWAPSSTDVWNAALGWYLDKPKPFAIHSVYAACQTKATSTWVLFLQTGTDLPTHASNGEAIKAGSCVETNIVVAEVVAF